MRPGSAPAFFISWGKAGIIIAPSNKQKDVKLFICRQSVMEGVVRMKFRGRLALVCLIVLIMFILHNSFWLWDLDARIPLLFGFMPFAFSFYVGYTVLALIAMKLIVTLAWPDPPAEAIELIKEREPSDR